jgi:hypothetical protein
MDEYFREMSILKVKSLLSILAVFLLGGVAADAQQDEVIKMRFAGYESVPLEEVLDRQAHRQAEDNEYRNRVAELLSPIAPTKKAPIKKIRSSKSVEKIKPEEVLKAKFAGYESVPLEEVLDRQARRQAENNAYRNRVASHWPKALRWDLRGQNLGSYCVPKQLCGSDPGTGFTEQPASGKPPFSDYGGIFQVLGVVEAGTNYGDPKDTKDSYKVGFYNTSSNATNLTMKLKGHPVTVTGQVVCPVRFDYDNNIVVFAKSNFSFNFSGSDNGSFWDGMSRTLNFCAGKDLVLPQSIGIRSRSVSVPADASYAVTMSFVDKRFAGWGHRW